MTIVWTFSEVVQAVVLGIIALAAIICGAIYGARSLIGRFGRKRGLR